MNDSSLFANVAFWVQHHAIESFIIAIFLLFAALIFISVRHLRTQLGLANDANAHLKLQMEENADLLKGGLVKLAESLAIRSENLENMSREQYHQFRQESEFSKSATINALTQLRDSFTQQQNDVQAHHNQQFIALQQLLSEQLNKQNVQVRDTINALNQTTESRLKDIATQVNQQLEKNLNKTQTTFADIQKRLAVIDEAQKRIDHLSSNVVSLQNVLTDKRARGAFGEMQLQTIVENALPPQFVDFQYTLSNDKRADCIIHLPEPNGDMVIDAKFPLESYRQLTVATQQGEKNTSMISQRFKRDIKKHITDIASKYILPPETAESAILFIPAEAIFAEIHAHHGDVVEFAQRQQIWLASPTTLMAILVTAKSVIKDDATRRQSHLMREQLHRLKDDFERFQARMNGLTKRIEQAGKEATDVSVSASKISKHFQRIESVGMDLPSP